MLRRACPVLRRGNPEAAKLSGVSLEELVDELLQGRDLLLLGDQIELLYKVHVMLEAGVQVRFGPEGGHALEMAVVDVGVDAE